MYEHKEVSITINTDGVPAEALKMIIAEIRARDEKIARDLKERVYDEGL